MTTSWPPHQHHARRVRPVGRTGDTARAFAVPEQASVLEVDVATWDHVNAVNVSGPLLTCQAVARVMVEQRIADRDRAEREGVPLPELRQRVLEQAAAANPLRRVGQPDGVADVVAFLLSDHSRHVNGQCIDITGGP